MLPRIGLTTSPSVLEGRSVEAVDRPYVSAVVEAGGLPVVLPVLDPSQAPAAVAGIDALLLTGGGDVDPAWYGSLPSPDLGKVDAARDGWEIALVRAAAARGLPVLGICRGAQLLNVAMGGTLEQHLPDVTDLRHCVDERCAEAVHDVHIGARSGLGAVVGTEVLGVNSLHHQAVADVGEGLVAVAWAEDGTVEAVEAAGGDDNARMLGVQWHPELLTAMPGHGALFRWLCAEASVAAPLTASTVLAATAG